MSRGDFGGKLQGIIRVHITQSREGCRYGVYGVSSIEFNGRTIWLYTLPLTVFADMPAVDPKSLRCHIQWHFTCALAVCRLPSLLPDVHPGHHASFRYIKCGLTPPPPPPPPSKKNKYILCDAKKSTDRVRVRNNSFNGFGFMNAAIACS